jgi:hypothetical protein
VVEGTLPPSDDDVAFDTFDPDLATVIMRFDGDTDTRALVIPPGEPVPSEAELASLDPAEFTTEFDADFEIGGPFNSAMLLPDGTLQRYWSEPADLGNLGDPSAPESFRYELTDGCTTLSGTALSGNGLFATSFGENTLEQISEGVWQQCDEEATIEPLNLLSIVLGGVGLVAPKLPPVEVIEIDGAWYVSPIRSVFASILVTVERVPDGEIFFLDSPLAPLLYSTDLATLEDLLIDRTLDELPETCGDFVVTDGSGRVTAVERTAPIASVQECYYGTFDGFGSFDEESVVEASSPTAVPASVPESGD